MRPASGDQTALPITREATVARLFAAQADRTPDRIALECGSAHVSYRELDARAGALACELSASGAGPEVPVGVYMERSNELFVAILGIVKAGGAYVPLDIHAPISHVRKIVEDAGVPILAADVKCVDDLAGLACHIVLTESSARRHPMARPLLQRVFPLNAAYVLHTSGSTGGPKGIVASHQSAANLAYAQFKAFGLESGDRVLQFSSIGFDASVSEWLTSLLFGLTLVLLPEGDKIVGSALIRALCDNNITIVTLPPSVLSQLTGELEPLRRLIVAGEHCPPGVVRRWAGNRTMLNAYGPAEATVCATISDPLDVNGAHAPIGRPIENVQVFVLDSSMAPCAPGVPGELYIGGIGVTRGYFKNHALTAERFVPNPFGSAGSRLYRTGDWGQRLHDGQFKFLNRIDRQVKLRGQRVEPAEIEAALLDYPGVTQVAVTLREDTPGDQRIVAYWAAGKNPTDALDVNSLRKHLRARLPDYMVPAAFVYMDGLPLTLACKIDYGALPRPAYGSTEGGHPVVQPRNSMEQRLAEIWKRLLGADSIGVHDDFFDLGGHSLLAVELTAEVAAVFGIDLDIRTIFDASTVAAQAALIRGAAEEHITRPESATVNQGQTASSVS